MLFKAACRAALIIYIIDINRHVINFNSFLAGNFFSFLFAAILTIRMSSFYVCYPNFKNI